MNLAEQKAEQEVPPALLEVMQAWQAVSAAAVAALREETHLQWSVPKSCLK